MFFFFNDPATTEIYTLSLHDALPICPPVLAARRLERRQAQRRVGHVPRGSAGTPVGRPGDPRDGDRPRPRQLRRRREGDRKSTRLNSSHATISYAVFCLKQKNPPNIN